MARMVPAAGAALYAVVAPGGSKIPRTVPAGSRKRAVTSGAGADRLHDLAAARAHRVACRGDAVDHHVEQQAGVRRRRRAGRPRAADLVDAVVERDVALAAAPQIPAEHRRKTPAERSTSSAESGGGRSCRWRGRRHALSLTGRARDDDARDVLVAEGCLRRDHPPAKWVVAPGRRRAQRPVGLGQRFEAGRARLWR
jgi:hypothetical protein